VKAPPPNFKMDLFVSDFIASAMTLTTPEKGALLWLLVVAWTQAASLPADPDRIRIVCGFDPEDWARLWPAIETKWPLTEDGTARRNPRQVREWDFMVERVEKAHEKAVEMNTGRWKNRVKGLPS
jgi:uncharacterized protein YdaU (DUF1376 family)